VADPPPNQLSAVIFNNTQVHLEVEVDQRTRESIVLEPGQETRVTLSAAQWINFGMIAHQYVLPDHVLWYAGPAIIYLQAEPDGSLYFVPPLMAFPASPHLDQPAGFPLRPINIVDLT
jgi:hypothetical protein